MDYIEHLKKLVSHSDYVAEKFKNVDIKPKVKVKQAVVHAKKVRKEPERAGEELFDIFMGTSIKYRPVVIYTLVKSGLTKNEVVTARQELGIAASSTEYKSVLIGTKRIFVSIKTDESDKKKKVYYIKKRSSKTQPTKTFVHRGRNLIWKE